MVTISVLITAYNRRNFIADAIRSVLNQTLKNDEFEIVVVKNFADPSIDELIQKNSIVSLLKGECSIGEMMHDGLKLCRGEIIALLDDDDMFEPAKLQKLKKIFSENENLCYYRNGYNEMDSQGNIISPKHRAGSLKIMRWTQALHMQSNKLRMNASCISFRKDVIENQYEVIRRINGAPDLALFYLAQDGECNFCLDPEPLTRYRIHGLSAMHSGNRNDYAREIETLNVLTESIRSKDILNDIERTKLRLSVLSAYKSGNLSRSYSHKLLKRFFKFPPRKVSDLFFLTVLLISSASSYVGNKVLHWIDKRGPKYR